MDLAEKIRVVVGFQGKISFDPQMPDGSPQKLMDSARINGLGWKASTNIDDGLLVAYQKFLQVNG
jgi:GDP-L-fucose synthase